MADEATATGIAFTKVANGTLARSATGSTAVWSFAVDYGDATYVCVSWEEGGDLHIGLVDVMAGPDSTGAWPIVNNTNLTEYLTWPGVPANVADHWHIYAFGYHILTSSVAGGGQLYMLVVDPSTLAIDTEIAVAGPNYDFEEILPGGVETNDHHCVEYDGTSVVAVALGSTAGGSRGMKGQYIHLVDISSGAVSALGEFADSTNPFIYESSALRVLQSDPCSAYQLGLLGSTTSTTSASDPWEWQVVAPGFMDRSTGANALYLLATDDLQTPTEMLALERSVMVDHELAMGTQVLFSNGWRLIMFRDRTAASALSGIGSDAGTILWWLFDENLALASGYSEAVPGYLNLVGGRLGNRPHVSRFSDGKTDMLLVGFDTSIGAMLRAYAITYS